MESVVQCPDRKARGIMFAEFEQYDPWARHWLRLLDDHGTSGTGAAGGSAADRSWTGTARTDRACRCQRRREQSYRARLGEAYEDALKDLLKKKQDGRPIERPERREPTNVVNLMEALRRRALRRAVSLLRAKKRHVPTPFRKSRVAKRKKARRAC